MKIYVISIDLLENADKSFSEMTDEEVVALCAKDMGMKDHDVYDSAEELAVNWNSEDIYYPSHSYMRVIEEPKDEFPITSVCREDLEAKGFDVSEVDDDTMERLASKMADDYCEQLFWTSMEIIAEYMDIPKKGEEDEDEDEDE